MKSSIQDGAAGVGVVYPGREFVLCMDEAGSFPTDISERRHLHGHGLNLVGVVFNSGYFPGLRCSFLIASGTATVEKSLFSCAP